MQTLIGILLPFISGAFLTSAPVPVPQRWPHSLARSPFSALARPARTTRIQLAEKQLGALAKGEDEATNRDRVRQRSFVGKIFGFVVDKLVTVVATPIALILAKAINHHSVRKALGQCIVSGFKDVCVDPHLDDYLDKAGKILNADIADDAREAGEVVPTLVKNFLAGLFRYPPDKSIQASEPSSAIPEAGPS